MGAINFALYSANATGVNLCLFTEKDLHQGRITCEVKLDWERNRTGDVWHIALTHVDPTLLYGYKVSGLHQERDEGSAGHRFDPTNVILDPYAQAVLSRRHYGKLGPQLQYGTPGVLGLAPTWPQAAAFLPSPDGSSDFDWAGDRPLNKPMEELIIYEMHVRGFTHDPSSNVQAPGTYQGLVEKLDYLQSLGVTAVELLPVQEFNELEYYSPIPGQQGAYRFNFWGYSTVSFFAPMSRFSAAIAQGGDGTALRNEFKMLVRECHKRGIEVILDIVFNHTAEGNDMGPTISFRGLDNRIYYTLAPGGEYYNYSGCGNTFNCNHPAVRTFIMDCLKYWVQEYHVDGFRFDLASILTRAPSTWHSQQYNAAGQRMAMHSGLSLEDTAGLLSEGGGAPTGTPLADPPVVEMISEDPVLRNTKLIAEAWDCDGLNQVGAFPHYGGRWSEWNGRFRDTVRHFIKGTDGPWAGNFAAAMCGSPNIYAHADPGDEWWASNAGRKWRGSRNPTASINFVTAHDGFTLADLVAYNEKHNEANGENNNDGESHNISWNCGDEGPTSQWPVLRLRQRQMRNLGAALLLAHGVPMLCMGDEYGHTKNGNNNTYCHDSPLNWFNWQQACEDTTGFARFMRLMIALRRSRPELRRSSFVTDQDIAWHGEQPGAPDWGESSRLVAYTLADGVGGGLYIAFNTAHVAKLLSLPAWPGRVWQPLVDTSKVAPYDILIPDQVLSAEEVQRSREAMSMWTADNSYPMLPWSCIVLESVPDSACATLKVATASKQAQPAQSAANKEPHTPPPKQAYRQQPNAEQLTMPHAASSLQASARADALPAVAFSNVREQQKHHDQQILEPSGLQQQQQQRPKSLQRPQQQQQPSMQHQAERVQLQMPAKQPLPQQQQLQQHADPATAPKHATAPAVRPGQHASATPPATNPALKPGGTQQPAAPTTPTPSTADTVARRSSALSSLEAAKNLAMQLASKYAPGRAAATSPQPPATGAGAQPSGTPTGAAGVAAGSAAGPAGPAAGSAAMPSSLTPEQQAALEEAMRENEALRKRLGLKPRHQGRQQL